MMEVTGTGLGMDETTRQRIFEPCFTTKERGKGMGLGLSTVFGWMEGHLGAVSVRSEPGQGTTFHCTFPNPTGHLSGESPPGNHLGGGGARSPAGTPNRARKKRCEGMGFGCSSPNPRPWMTFFLSFAVLSPALFFLTILLRDDIAQR